MSAGPIAERDRAEILDVLRGFALLGIFAAHVPGFSGWDYLSVGARAALDPGVDPALQWLRDVLVRGKFFSLFSLLFGFGFAVQIASARRRDADFGRLFRRRLLWLLGIGAVHSLFWHGDILFRYALIGLVLLPTASWSARRTLVLALACFGVRTLWGLGVWLGADGIAALGSAAVRDGAGGTDVAGRLDTVMAGFHSPHWIDVVQGSLRMGGMKWLSVLYEGRLFSILGLFALGAALGKTGLHRQLDARCAGLRTAVLVLGPIGLAGNVALAFLWRTVPVYPPSAAWVLQNALFAWATPALALAMAAALALAWRSVRGRLALGWLAPAGRMALTTYLTQTAIGLGLFYGIGLGWRGTFSLAACTLTVAVVLPLQALACRLWLSRFRYGPLEWAWRRLTYGRPIPLRRSTRPAPLHTIARSPNERIRS